MAGGRGPGQSRMNSLPLPDPRLSSKVRAYVCSQTACPTVDLRCRTSPRRDMRPDYLGDRIKMPADNLWKAGWVLDDSSGMPMVVADACVGRTPDARLALLASIRWCGTTYPRNVDAVLSLGHGLEWMLTHADARVREAAITRLHSMSSVAEHRCTPVDEASVGIAAATAPAVR